LPGVLRTKVDRVDLKKSLIVCDYYMLSNWNGQGYIMVKPMNTALV
jgi:hypothetical protein